MKRILILPELANMIEKRGWGRKMHGLIGKSFEFNADNMDKDHDRYYITYDGADWNVPLDYIKIIEDDDFEKGKIRWYKDGKLEKNIIKTFEQFNKKEIDPYGEESITITRNLFHEYMMIPNYMDENEEDYIPPYPIDVLVENLKNLIGKKVKFASIKESYSPKRINPIVNGVIEDVKTRIKNFAYPSNESLFLFFKVDGEFHWVDWNTPITYKAKILKSPLDPYGEEIWESFNKLDPYGEEDWSNKLEIKVGDIVISNFDGKYVKKGLDYEVTDIVFSGDFIGLKGVKNWHNKDLFTKINENINLDLDPYGEENWDDVLMLKKYQDIVSEWKFANVSEIEADMDGMAFSFSFDYPHRGMLNFSINEEDGRIFLSLTDAYHNYDSYNFIKLDEPDKNKVWDAVTKLAEKIKPND